VPVPDVLSRAPNWHYGLIILVRAVSGGDFGLIGIDGAQ
jgi:hypothetical protein